MDLVLAAILQQAAEAALEQERHRLLQRQRLHQHGGGGEQGLDPNEHPIIDAARNGDVSRVLAYILSGTSPNTKNSKGSTPLSVASIRGLLSVVKLLVQQRARIDDANNNGDTALSLSVWKNRTDCAIYLMQAGANVQRIDRFGETVLIDAIKHQNLTLVATFLDSGRLMVAHRDKNNKTALHHALEAKDQFQRRLMVAMVCNAAVVQNAQPLIQELQTQIVQVLPEILDDTTAPSSPSPSTKPKTCNHALKSFTSNGHVCDLCRASFAKGTDMIGCRTCNYDECLLCNDIKQYSVIYVKEAGGKGKASNGAYYYHRMYNRLPLFKSATGAILYSFSDRWRLAVSDHPGKWIFSSKAKTQSSVPSSASGWFPPLGMMWECDGEFGTRNSCPVVYREFLTPWAPVERGERLLLRSHSKLGACYIDMVVIDIIPVGDHSQQEETRNCSRWSLRIGDRDGKARRTVEYPPRTSVNDYIIIPRNFSSPEIGSQMFAPFIVSGVSGGFAWFRGEVKARNDRNKVVTVAFENGREGQYQCPSLESGDAFLNLSKDIIQETKGKLDTVILPISNSWRVSRERLIRKTLQRPSSSHHSHTVYKLEVLGTMAAAWVDLGYHVTSLKGFPSIVACGPKLSQSMELERWYFEAIILSDGQMRVGWTVKERFDPLRSDAGIGDCIHSWGYDGSRQLVFHNGRRSKGGVPRRRWRTGDVVGCGVDLETREIRFWLNGEPAGIAFRGINAGAGLMPAASLLHWKSMWKGRQTKQSLRFIFERDQLQYIPCGYHAFKDIMSKRQTVLQFAEGELVEFCNLSSMPSLNGTRGRVTGPPVDGRYPVKIPGRQKPYNLKPKNLQRIQETKVKERQSKLDEEEQEELKRFLEIKERRKKAEEQKQKNELEKKRRERECEKVSKCLRIGQRVKISNLAAFPQFNGTPGLITGGEVNGRYPVQIEGRKKPFKLKRENLEVVIAGDSESDDDDEEDLARFLNSKCNDHEEVGDARARARAAIAARKETEKKLEQESLEEQELARFERLKRQREEEERKALLVKQERFEREELKSFEKLKESRSRGTSTEAAEARDCEGEMWNKESRSNNFRKGELKGSDNVEERNAQSEISTESSRIASGEAKKRVQRFGSGSSLNREYLNSSSRQGSDLRSSTSQNGDSSLDSSNLSSANEAKTETSTQQKQWFWNDPTIQELSEEIFDKLTDGKEEMDIGIRSEFRTKHIPQLFPDHRSHNEKYKIWRSLRSVTGKAKTIIKAQFMDFLWLQLPRRTKILNNEDTFVEKANIFVLKLLARADPDSIDMPSLEDPDDVIGELQRRQYRLLNYHAYCNQGLDSAKIGQCQTLQASEIGEGSFGKVYCLVNEEDGFPYAIKVINKAKIDVTHLKREQAQHARLKHHHIVGYKGSWSSKSRVFIELELCDTNLYKLLKAHGAPKISATITYVRQIASALSYMHNEAKVTHRDLKADNILIGRDGGIRIGDIGLATPIGTCTALSTVQLMTLKDHKKRGNVVYQAPEEVPRGGSIDNWAMGLVASELIVGKLIAQYARMERDALFPAHRDKKLLCDLRDESKKVDKRLHRVVSGLLECNVCRRLTAVEVMESLRELPSLGSEVIAKVNSLHEEVEIVQEMMVHTQNSVKRVVKSSSRNVSASIKKVHNSLTNHVTLEAEITRNQIYTWVEEMQTKMSQLLINLALNPNVKSIPTYTLIIPKHPPREGMIGWFKDLFKGAASFFRIRQYFSIYVCDEGPHLLGLKSAPQKPLHEPIEISVPGALLRQLEPVLRVMSAILFIAKIAGAAYGLSPLIPINILSKLGTDLDIKTQNTLRELAENAANLGEYKTQVDFLADSCVDEYTENKLLSKAKHSEQPNIQKVVGGSFNALENVLCPEDVTKTPTNCQGETLRSMIGTKFLIVFNKHGEYHWVAKEHWEKLKLMGFSTHSQHV